MKAVYFKQTLAVCALGVALVACSATDEEVAVEAASNDLFAPATSATNVAASGASSIPSPLANTNVAVSNGNILSTQGSYANAVSGQVVSNGVLNQTGLTAIPVPVVQATRPAQTQVVRQVACPRPTTKAALAAYAANCAGTAPIQAPTQTRSVVQQPMTTSSTGTTQPRVVTGPVSGQVSTTFAPAQTVSCGVAPTTKAALAAYRANCVTSSSAAPVAQPAAQTAVVAPVAQAAAASTSQNELNLAPASAPVAESAAAPEGSALFDCSKDPTTGAELALYRAYCQ